MGMEYWWNDAVKRNPKYWKRELYWGHLIKKNPT
jgi:hypothetical protein